MGENLVVGYGGVIVYVDVFDGNSGDFGEQDAAKGICEGGVDAD